MRSSTARSTGASPEHLRQPDHQPEVTLKGSSALQHRGGRVDRSSADADEIRERDAKLDGGVIAGAAPRVSATTGDLDRPPNRRRAGGLTPEFIDDPSLKAARGVGVEADSHHAEHHPLHHPGAEQPLERRVAGAVDPFGE